MLIDSFGRKITYARISLTDRCNLNCRYCRDEAGVEIVSHSELLRLEDIISIIKKLVDKGIEKVRLTGGEPLLRKNVVYLVEQLAKIKNLKDISMTTNGILLPKYAQSLHDAGLKRINISLDTLNAKKYRYITRGGKLSDVLIGIKTSKKVGFKPIKINTVLINGFNDNEKEAIKQFCKEFGLISRFIKEMNLSKGIWSGVEGDGKNETGLCRKCNKIRITCFGKILPCLFSDLSIDLKKIDFNDALKETLKIKPKQGNFNSSLSMKQIGG